MITFNSEPKKRAPRKGYNFSALIVYENGVVEQRYFQSKRRARQWTYNRPLSKARNMDYSWSEACNPIRRVVVEYRHLSQEED
jgi:hypothetical protein